MTSLADNLTDAADMAGTTNGRPCRYAAIMAGLNDTDRTALTNAVGHLADDRVAVILRGHGHKISASTLYRHRLALCTCDRR